MKRLRNENPDLDVVDLGILRMLAEDARTSVAEIARSVGMSAPSVSERIRRLQENGTIQAYTIRIDPAAFGLPLSASTLSTKSDGTPVYERSEGSYWPSTSKSA